MLSADQKYIRSNGLTGSEMAAVCGLSPWAGPINVYASKLHQAPEVDWKDSDGLIRGTLFEEPVLRWYEIKAHRKVLEPREWAATDTNTLVHPQYSIVIATPDGISCGGPGEDDLIVEVKCPGWRMGHHWGEEGTDAIPEYYRPQVIWEMAVTGLKVAHVVAYLGDAPKIFRVDWDQELFEALHDTAKRFWFDHILSRVPPPVDGSPAYGAWIARQYPASRLDTYREMDATIAPWVRKLKRLRALGKRLTVAEAECAQRIQLFIGDAAGLTCGEMGRIDFKNNKDSRIVDWKRLCREKLGDDTAVLEPYTTTRTGARPFTPRFAKGA